MAGWSSVRARLTSRGRRSPSAEAGSPFSSPSLEATTSRARLLMWLFLLARRLPTELRKIWVGSRDRQFSSTFSAYNMSNILLHITLTELSEICVGSRDRQFSSPFSVYIRYNILL